MVKPCIDIEKIWFDTEEFCEYRFRARNSYIETVVEFYSNDALIKEFSESLKSFPSSIDEQVSFGARGYGNVDLTVFCYEPNGNTVIHIQVDVDRGVPGHYRADFCIPTKPASINEMGKQLSLWKPSEGAFSYTFND
jgi:hypothetical protein